MSPVEELRKAAVLMRERAEAAQPAPWEADGWEIYGPMQTMWVGETLKEGGRGEADAVHIASWHPQVALAVADLLDAEAVFADESPFYADLSTDEERVEFLGPVLALARAYLGGES